MHQSQLSRMVEFQAGNAFTVRKHSGLCQLKCASASWKGRFQALSLTWPKAVALMTATSATPSSTILLRCGEAMKARNIVKIWGARRPSAGVATVAIASGALLDRFAMDYLQILPRLTSITFTEESA